MAACRSATAAMPGATPPAAARTAARDGHTSSSGMAASGARFGRIMMAAPVSRPTRESPGGGRPRTRLRAEGGGERGRPQRGRGHVAHRLHELVQEGGTACQQQRRRGSHAGPASLRPSSHVHQTARSPISGTTAKMAASPAMRPARGHGHGQPGGAQRHRAAVGARPRREAGWREGGGGVRPRHRQHQRRRQRRRGLRRTCGPARRSSASRSRRWRRRPSGCRRRPSAATPRR